MANTKKMAITRVAVAIFAAVNAILTAKGQNPLPFDENVLTEFISYAFDFAMLVWVWWKDAPMTKAGQKAHEIMKSIKADDGQKKWLHRLLSNIKKSFKKG